MGGGLAGVRAAAAEVQGGNRVYFVESSPGIGGERIPRDRIVTGDEEFILPPLAPLKASAHVDVLTHTDVEQLVQAKGGYEVTLRRRSSRINSEKCDDCRACVQVCPVHMYDDYNEGLEWRSAIDFFNASWGHVNIFHEQMPACQKACPIHLDVRAYTGQIADGRFAESLATIRKKLPFPLSIGRLCPHPCEQACNRGQRDEPIGICGLKRFVADHETLRHETPEVEPPKVRSEQKIAIIGAGPSGLTCAYHLALLGYGNVTVFEALPKPGGMLWAGIPEYRLPKAVLARDIDFIVNHGVKIRTGVRVGKDLDFETLRQENDALLIAVGAHQAMKLGIKNENVPGVIEGIAFLRDVALGNTVPHGGTAVIVGGGNVAIDVARTCIRLGFETVEVLYRRTRKEMPASPWEITAAEAEGVSFRFLVTPTEVVVKGGTVQGVRCVEMELGPPDESGRRRPLPLKGSCFTQNADTIFTAIGQVPDAGLVAKTSGFNFGPKQRFQVNPDTFETDVAGVFASGDAVTGADIAIRACATGKAAAEAIHRYLRGKLQHDPV